MIFYGSEVPQIYITGLLVISTVSMTTSARLPKQPGKAPVHSSQPAAELGLLRTMWSLGQDLTAFLQIQAHPKTHLASMDRV